MIQTDEIQTTDQVIREVREIQETLARSMDYDVHRIPEDARRRQQTNDGKIMGAPISSRET
uniref:Uncharacterized protein n=1 Tax=Candidatus Kentrum sp. DK TaxID=2126562 RepID=A0A450T131_9GAMM|nr:MAG: hypothetical protein BECKDK2373C_GA0170839_10795 [Candidatus Kentron sp. DK]VFJ61335.1 MAG: hypothetical protein BECKDK2373B_GA0170837_110010 [Candidatus Kentron sp. DK]